MKTITISLLLCVGCAHTTLSHIKNDSLIPTKIINETYTDAVDIFSNYTKCPVPSSPDFTVRDDTIKSLNYGRNGFYIVDGKILIGIIMGEYKPGSNSIYIAIEHPDQQRLLFHEMIHYLFHRLYDFSCPSYSFIYDTNVDEEHKSVRAMEDIYFIRTARKPLTGDWLYLLLKGE